MLGLKLSDGSNIEKFVTDDEDQKCVVQIGDDTPSMITVKSDTDDFINELLSSCTDITSDSLDDDSEITVTIDVVEDEPQA